MPCPYCEDATNVFVDLNQTAEYSGVEMAINRQGMLRARVYDDHGLLWQDIVSVKHCPMCGRRFTKPLFEEATSTAEITWRAASSIPIRIMRNGRVTLLPASDVIDHDTILMGDNSYLVLNIHTNGDGVVVGRLQILEGIDKHSVQNPWPPLLWEG